MGACEFDHDLTPPTSYEIGMNFIEILPIFYDFYK